MVAILESNTLAPPVSVSESPLILQVLAARQHAKPLHTFLLNSRFNPGCGHSGRWGLVNYPRLHSPQGAEQRFPPKTLNLALFFFFLCHIRSVNVYLPDRFLAGRNRIRSFVAIAETHLTPEEWSKMLWLFPFCLLVFGREVDSGITITPGSKIHLKSSY